MWQFEDLCLPKLTNFCQHDCIKGLELRWELVTVPASSKSPSWCASTRAQALWEVSLTKDCALQKKTAWPDIATVFSIPHMLSAQRFLGLFGWTNVTYDWLMVALNTIDQSLLKLVHPNDPRNPCAKKAGTHFPFSFLTTLTTRSLASS